MLAEFRGAAQGHFVAAADIAEWLGFGHVERYFSHLVDDRLDPEARNDSILRRAPEYDRWRPKEMRTSDG